MGKFDDKTLLILGSNVGATDIIKYANKEGAYTIVADYYPKEKSPAKKYAKKNILVSTADMEGLEKIVKEDNVDGILAGISEFNLIAAMKLSEKCKLPFFCTEKQWNLIERKDSFRMLCEKNKVPCPKTYYIGEYNTEINLEKIVYPVVVKPVDSCASMGVHICYTQEELQNSIPDAFAQSDSKKIIIEEFIEGDEFTAHYTIVNGKAVLSCIDNRYPVSVNEGKVTTIPAARIYPCLFVDEYITQVNESMLCLCNNLFLNNAVIFIQGLYNKITNQFYIFEGGLRLAAEAPYRFIEKLNGNNALNLLVDQVLSVDSEFNPEIEEPKLQGKCCGIVSFVSLGGVVGKIIGLENAVKETPSVIEWEKRYDEGDETPQGNTLRQLMIRFVMICNSREQMARDIEYLNNHITVLDVNGKNMVKKLEPQRIFDIK